jgi:parvulin-like peptidyl-prolyl isomerase
MEEVERAIKQQAQGQENRLSPLELAAGRLQVLQSLIEQEVMFQKAEAEGTVPTDDEVNGEFNRRKTASGMSQEQWDAKMKEIGETDASARLSIKKALAIQKLQEKITGKIEPPKDNEIAQFYNNNPAAFKNKRGAQLGAIVIDPSDSGQGDVTRNDLEAQAKAKELGTRVMQGADFATVAREASEDANTRMQGGDWRYFTEEEMKQAFGQEFATFVMTQMQNGQIFRQILPFENRYLIVKLQRKQETDEDRTLETPGVRQEITDYLINSRKQLLAASYQAIAMNDAKIENFLAKKVVNNPNELSGARPAMPAGSNSNSEGNTIPAGNSSNSANAANVPANSNAANPTVNTARPSSNAVRPAGNAPPPAAAPNTSRNTNN